MNSSFSIQSTEEEKEDEEASLRDRINELL